MILDNKVAFITGASSGIGAASARKLGKAGAKLALLSRAEDELEDFAESLNADTLVVVGDITSEDDLTSAYKQIEDKWGQLDIVFANAGINGVWAPIEDLQLEDWKNTLNINLTGTFLTIKHSLPLLKKGGGSVIITSSVNGTRMFSNTGASAYASSKAGQLALGQMLAPELAKYGVRINVVCPGAIDTDIEDNTERVNLDDIRLPINYPEGTIPLTGKTPGTGEQVADLVLFLASDASSHITGTPIWIDGGQSLLQG